MSMNTKTMKIIFTVSVIVNVLLLGAVGGLAYQHWNDEPYRAIHAEMSPEARNIVARTMQDAFRSGREDMKQAREIKKDIRTILAAPEFDADAFEIQAREMQAIMSKMGEKRIEVTKQLAAQLSQQDRKVLAEKFSKGFHGYNKKGTKGKSRGFLKDGDGSAEERIKGVRPLSDPDLPEDMPPQPVTP